MGVPGHCGHDEARTIQATLSVHLRELKWKSVRVKAVHRRSVATAGEEEMANTLRRAE